MVVTKRIEQTDIAKGIGIILVVIGHAFPDSTKLTGGSFSYYLYNLIYSFHMPFFFFISGLVSSGIMNLRGWDDKKAQIKKKFMRLIIPYIVFGVIFIPLRVIFGGFARFDYDFTKLYTVLIGNNPCGQLWFLYVLFVFSLTAIFFATKKNIPYLTVAAFAISSLSPFATLRYDGIAWSNSLFMLFFFYLGLLVSQYHDRLYDFIKPKLLFAIVPAFALSCLLFFATDKNHMAKMLTSLTGICLMLCLAALISKCRCISTALKEIGAYSMDVYIFHSPMGIVWRILLLKLLSVPDIAYMAVYIITGVVGSYMISRFIVRRVPIFRLLFLGMPFSKSQNK